MRVLRTFTSANSPATKKPLAATRANTANSPTNEPLSIVLILTLLRTPAAHALPPSGREAAIHETYYRIQRPAASAGRTSRSTQNVAVSVSAPARFRYWHDRRALSCRCKKGARPGLAWNVGSKPGPVGTTVIQ